MKLFCNLIIHKTNVIKQEYIECYSNFTWYCKYWGPHKVVTIVIKKTVIIATPGTSGFEKNIVLVTFWKWVNFVKKNIKKIFKVREKLTLYNIPEASK